MEILSLAMQKGKEVYLLQLSGEKTTGNHFGPSLAGKMGGKNVETRKRELAIVIGGGIAGLVAARILANHYSQIILIERDHYPDQPVFRPGAPQGRQVHTLLLRGQHNLEILFPRLKEHLIAQGAVKHNYGTSFVFYGGRCPLIPCEEFEGWICSRPLLEWQIRQELLISYPQVQFLEGYEVLHLLCDRSSVTGVQYRLRSHQNSGAFQELQADLVIDASGASSKATHWLKELGYETPKEEVVDSALGYASRFYRRPAHAQHYGMIAIQSTLAQNRGGVLLEIEKDQWMVVLAGIHGDYPPSSDKEYLEFAHSLPDQVLYEAIKDAESLTSIFGYRRTKNHRWHYEKVKLPENFLLLGDAVCSFNPLYGQGMTIATLEALALDECLKSKKTTRLARRFQHKVARITMAPWLLATASDNGEGFATWYMKRFIPLLSRDSKTYFVFAEIIHMLRPGSALFHPSILFKVLRGV